MEVSRHISATQSFFKDAEQTNELVLELIAKHDVRAGCSDLVINVKPADNSLFPVVRPALLHNQVNRIGLIPFVQNRFFVQKNVGGGCAHRSFFPGILVNKKESSIEIKNKTAAVVQRPFEHRVAACLQPRIQVTGDIGE